MKIHRLSFLRFLPLVLAAAFLSARVFAQDQAATPAAAPASVTTSPVAAPTEQMSAADMEKMMQQMMELSKPGENQKLLASFAGDWTCTIKMWMNPDPKAPPTESKGSAVRKMIFNGRYLMGDYSSKMKMPGPDGKMKESDFKGMGIDAYDNVKKKFVSSWIDSVGTGIMQVEGEYDPASKTLTYLGEMEGMPGMKTKVRQVIKITDKDHNTLEWYEDHGGQEAKTMEISYTRKK